MYHLLLSKEHNFLELIKWVARSQMACCVFVWVKSGLSATATLDPCGNPACNYPSSALVHLTKSRRVTILNLSAVAESSYLTPPAGKQDASCEPINISFQRRIAGGGGGTALQTTSALCDSGLSWFHFGFLTTVNAGDTLVIHLRESD